MGVDEVLPVGHQFAEGRLLLRRGRDHDGGLRFRRPLQARPGQDLRDDAQSLTVRVGFVEETRQAARLVLDQPEDAVQHVDKRGGLARIGRQPELGVVAPLGEVT